MARTICMFRGPAQTEIVPLPKDDDIVLVAEDGRVYSLEKAEYTAEKFRVSDTGRLGDQIKMLTDEGALLAFVPSNKQASIGAACYLLNLRDLRQPSDKQRAAPSPPPGPVLESRREEDEEPLRSGEGDEATGGLHS